MEFDVQWSAPEFVAAHVDALRRHPWKTAGGLYYPLIFVVIGVVALASGNWRGGIATVLIGVVLAAFVLGLTFWRLRRKGKKLAQEPPIRCTADGQGLVLRTQSVVETHAWPEFSAATETKNYFRLDRLKKKAQPIYLATSLMTPVQIAELSGYIEAGLNGRLTRAAGAR